MAVSKRQISRPVSKLNKKKFFRFSLMRGTSMSLCYKIYRFFDVIFLLMLNLHFLQFNFFIKLNSCIRAYGTLSLCGSKVILNTLNYILFLRVNFRQIPLLTLQHSIYGGILIFLKFQILKISIPLRNTRGALGWGFKFRHKSTAILNNVAPCNRDITSLIFSAIYAEIGAKLLTEQFLFRRSKVILQVQWDKYLWAFNTNNQIYKNFDILKYQKNIKYRYLLVFTIRTKFFVLKTWLCRVYVKQFFLWICNFFLKIKHLYLILNRIRVVTYKFSWLYHYGFKKLLRVLNCGISTRWALISIKIPFKRLGFFTIINYYGVYSRQILYQNSIFSDFYFNMWKLSNVNKLLFLSKNSGLVSLGLNRSNKKLLMSTNLFINQNSHCRDLLANRFNLNLFSFLDGRFFFEMMGYNSQRFSFLIKFFINFNLFLTVIRATFVDRLVLGFKNDFINLFTIFIPLSYKQKLLFLYLGLDIFTYNFSANANNTTTSSIVGLTTLSYLSNNYTR